MTNYDPAIAPDPTVWLALGEQERIYLVEKHHRVAKVKLPHITLHASFHVVVENQVAEGLQSTVRAMDRLMKEGLSRHDALHAIGSVVADHCYKAMHAKDSEIAKTIQVSLDTELERLSAKKWMKKYGNLH